MARAPESGARPGLVALRLISGGAEPAARHSAAEASGAEPAARRSESQARGGADRDRAARRTARAVDGAKRSALRERRSADRAAQRERSTARRDASAAQRGAMRAQHSAAQREPGAARRGMEAMRRGMLRFAPAPAAPASWIGRDFGEPRAQPAPRRRRWPGVLAGLVAAGLLLAGLRMAIVRERYLLGEAIQVETTLQQRARAASVAVRELRDPRRLRRLALQTGFARPERAIELGGSAGGHPAEAGLGRRVERREP